MVGSERDIITERNSEIRELELENDLLRGETGSLDLYIRQLKAEATEKDARIAALTEELERVKGLVIHMWIHAGYKNGGVAHMTTQQREHFEALLKEPT